MASAEKAGMKLVIAVVHDRDKQRVIEDLVRSGFKFTVVSSTGGFLREGNTTLLIGVEEEDREALLELIRRNCQMREQLVSVLPPDASQVGLVTANPVKVPVGGAVIFVVDVEHFERC
jgi:uncharacterized protein YaaQ